MRLFRRTPRLPADRRPELARDERVIAWAAADGGADGAGADGGDSAHGGVDGAATVVATNHALHLPRVGRFGWHEVNKATWSGRELTVTPAAVLEQRAGYAVIADGPPVTVRLIDPGDVPDQVRTRVTRSVLHSTQHAEPAMRIVARRASGVDGLQWAVRYEPGVDPTDDAVRTATEELLAAAHPALSPRRAGEN